MRAILTRNIRRNHQFFLPTASSYYQSASLCIGPSKPNPKTLIFLKNLPVSLTNQSFQQTIQSIDTIRKSEVEPGCALHVIDEVKAEYAAQQIRSFNLKVMLTHSLTHPPLPSIHSNSARPMFVQHVSPLLSYTTSLMTSHQRA